MQDINQISQKQKAEAQPQKGAFNRLLKKLLIASFLVHSTVILLPMITDLISPTHIQDVGIEAELVFEDYSANSDPIKGHKTGKTNKTKVQKELLPQLTKQAAAPMQQENEPKEADEKPIIIPSKKTLAKESKPKKIKKTDPEPKETKEELDKRKELKKIAREKTKKDASRRLLKQKKLDELRALKEEARKESSFAEKTEIKKGNGLSNQLSLEEKRSLTLWQSALKFALHKVFVLPAGYDFKNKKLKSGISIEVDSKGQLKRHDISETSGNALYDATVIKALRIATLPRPPSHVIGKPVKLYYSYGGTL